MAKLFRLVCLVVLGACAAFAPALAQRGPLDTIFGTIFGEPPRPPTDVPGRSIPPPENITPDLPPPTRLPPGPPPSARLPGPPQGAIRSQPLPPPPGARAAPDPLEEGALRPSGQPPLSGLPGGQRQPRGTALPANTAPQPGDEVVTAPPAQKIVNPTAVFSGLDKITGRIIKFDVAIDETVQFGALQVTPRVCYTRPPTETPNTDAFVEIDEVTLQGEVRRIFAGWMFAASPGLNAVEHPIYDLWLSDCKGGTATVTAETQPPERSPPPTVQQRPRPRPPQAPPAVR